VNELRIVANEWPTEFAIRTTSGPTPFVYVYGFSAENGVTVVRLEAEVELDGVASILAQLARRAVRRGVDANLGTLKRLLEGTATGDQLRSS
jgi:hypothetical protein